MNLSFRILIALAAMVLTPFIAEAKKQKTEYVNIELPTQADASRRFGNLDYGLRIQVINNVDERSIINIGELPGKEAEKFPRVSFDSGVKESVEQYLDNLATTLGFQIGTSYDTDYILRVNVKELRLRVKSYNVKQKIYSSSAAMVLNWELLNADREVVIESMTTTGHKSSRSQSTLFKPLGEAFAEALDAIDWDRIASQLKIAKNARQEKNKQVTGQGNTALENTVIRWFITSRPQGADVSWRVVSSTPDVKNTNANYVGSTPYESTESFDIKGLT
ncbi:MAG: hypothetical protein K2L33_06245, partial [Muribaculaceae bacterium]|nr:hypothetical protein [Muribaculaceae bacterium]